MKKKSSPSSYGSKPDSRKSFKEAGKAKSSGKEDRPYKKSSGSPDSAFSSSGSEDKGRKKPYGTWGAGANDESKGKRVPYGTRSTGPGGEKKAPYSGRAAGNKFADKPSHFDRKDEGGSKRPYEKRDGDHKFSDRPARPSGEGDRPARPYPKKDFGGEGPSRPPRDSGGDRPARPYPKKDGDKTSRPYEKKTGGKKDFGDRPARPSRDGGSDRPARPGKSFDKKDSRDNDSGAPRAKRPFSDGEIYKEAFSGFNGRKLYKPSGPKKEKDPEEEIEEKPKTAFKTPHKFKKAAEAKTETPRPDRDDAKPRKRRRHIEEEEEEEIEDNQPMPLNKFIAHSGECSRRDAGELVKQGKVKVNGELITDPGYRVQEMDQVTLLGKKLTPTKDRAYVLLNKPKGFITTTEDPKERKTIMDLVNNTGVERLYPVGRLDRNTSGLLLMTNDGDLAQKLSHPSYNIKKVYQVTLDKQLTKADFDKIMEGVTLDDGIAHVDSMAQLEEKNEVGLEIHSGRNRIVRRIFESLGYVVEKLDRVMYAGLTKKNLPRGKWRFLTEEEIIHLKHFKS